jgi:hypothetical protein
LPAISVKSSFAFLYSLFCFYMASALPFLFSDIFVFKPLKLVSSSAQASAPQHWVVSLYFFLQIVASAGYAAGSVRTPLVGAFGLFATLRRGLLQS